MLRSSLCLYHRQAVGALSLQILLRRRLLHRLDHRLLHHLHLPHHRSCQNHLHPPMVRPFVRLLRGRWPVRLDLNMVLSILILLLCISLTLLSGSSSRKRQRQNSDAESDNESPLAQPRRKFIENANSRTKTHSRRAITLLRKVIDMNTATQPYILLYIAR